MLAQGRVNSHNVLVQKNILLVPKEQKIHKELSLIALTDSVDPDQLVSEETSDKFIINRTI